MGVDGSRVAIVGGSVAGCAMAVAAARLGCHVTVFEASSADLEDRGAGIFIPLALRDRLAGAGYLPKDAPYCHPPERVWIIADPSERFGRVMWRHAFPGAAHNWGVLWRGLRSLVPDAVYRKGRSVRACQAEGEQVTVVLDDGSTQSFDLVIGADGYRSSVREAVRPDVRPAYAGYILWRGNFEEDRISDSVAAQILDQQFLTICFRGGHVILYLIPGRDGAIERGARRVNWAIYGSPPAGIDFTEPTSFPPGRVPAALVEALEQVVAEHLPPAWADVVRVGGPEVLSVQPIYDHVVPTFVTGRVLLVGDAAALSRPHTAGGVVKAMEEAVALEAAGSLHNSWPEILAAFDTERCAAATELVEISRLLGHGLVEHCPDWAALTEKQVEQYTSGLIRGRNLYMQPSGR